MDLMMTVRLIRKQQLFMFYITYRHDKSVRHIAGKEVATFWKYVLEANCEIIW